MGWWIGLINTYLKYSDISSDSDWIRIQNQESRIKDSIQFKIIRIHHNIFSIIKSCWWYLYSLFHHAIQNNWISIVMSFSENKLYLMGFVITFRDLNLTDPCKLGHTLGYQSKQKTVHYLGVYTTLLYKIFFHLPPLNWFYSPNGKETWVFTPSWVG